MAVGQSKGFQGEVHGDHGQHTGEQVHEHRCVHQSLPGFEPGDRHGVGHHNHKQRGDHAGPAGDDKGVPEPCGELVHRVRCQQLDIVDGAPFLREEGGGVHAGIGAEGGADQPHNGNDPDDAQQCNEGVVQENSALLPCLTGLNRALAGAGTDICIPLGH